MRAYSIDLRERVIAYIKAGKSQKSATEVFGLHKATINKWWKRYQEEGHVNARKNLGSKPKVDRLLLERYVENNAEFTAADISLLFKVSKVSAYYHIKRLGYSYKKKPSPMWKRVRKSEIST